MDAEQVTAERATVGALLLGRLMPRDLARDDVPDLLTARLHRGIVGVLLGLYEAREAGLRIPGRTGIDLRAAMRACDIFGVGPVGGLVAWESGPRHGVEAVGYLPTLAREAPRRPDALAALATLRRLAWERAARAEDIASERETFVAAMAEIVADTLRSYSRRVREDGGVMMDAPSVKVRDAAGVYYDPRSMVRPVGDDAMPSGAELAAAVLERIRRDERRERPADVLTYRVAALPDGHDPDSFIREHGAAALRDIADAAEE